MLLFASIHTCSTSQKWEIGVTVSCELILLLQMAVFATIRGIREVRFRDGREKGARDIKSSSSFVQFMCDDDREAACTVL